MHLAMSSYVDLEVPDLVRKYQADTLVAGSPARKQSLFSAKSQPSLSHTQLAQ